MSFFGFSSKKEVEEKERLAREAGKRAILQSQQSSLSNIAKGTQIKFRIPFFDVFDPRFENFAVPVAVQIELLFTVDDIAQFNRINKAQSVSDSMFQDKVRGQITKYIKDVITKAPSDYRISVLQMEQEIVELSALIQQKVSPQIEKLFAINVRSLDILEITVDKRSRGYCELKAVTTELERDSLKRKQEMNLGGQEELQRMKLEHQRETMRIQREELQRASRLQTETNFLGAHQANLNAGLLNTTQPQGRAMVPPMPGAAPQVQYMVGINGQQVGPCDWNLLQQLVQQGLLTHKTYVWKQGMSQWMLAGDIQELAPLFRGTIPPMPSMPPMPEL